METDSQTQPAGGMREVLAPPRVPRKRGHSIGEAGEVGPLSLIRAPE